MGRSHHITPADREVYARYCDTTPDPLGNLHQRMKAVLARAQQIELWNVDNLLWQYLHDLLGEVRYHQPASPPFAQRAVRT